MFNLEKSCHQVLTDRTQRDLRRDERDVVIRSQEHTELFLGPKDLTHPRINWHNVIVNKVTKFVFLVAVFTV